MARKKRSSRPTIGRSSTPTPRSTPTDRSTLARADLKRLAAAIGGRDSAGLGAYTEAHLDETAARIEAALTAGIERQVS